MDVNLDETTSTDVLNCSTAPEMLDLRTIRLVYVSDETEDQYHLALEQATEVPTGVSCALCGFVATQLSRHKIHLRQHFVNFVCRCGEVSYNKDTIGRHIRRRLVQSGPTRCQDGLRYEVDAASFPQFVKETGSPLLVFPAVRHTLEKGSDEWEQTATRSFSCQKARMLQKRKNEGQEEPEEGRESIDLKSGAETKEPERAKKAKKAKKSKSHKHKSHKEKKWKSERVQSKDQSPPPARSAAPAAPVTATAQSVGGTPPGSLPPGVPSTPAAVCPPTRFACADIRFKGKAPAVVAGPGVHSRLGRKQQTAESTHTASTSYATAARSGPSNKGNNLPVPYAGLGRITNSHY